MYVGNLVGLDISVDKNEEGDTVATVSIYPHVIKVTGKSKDDYKKFWNEIEEAIFDLEANRNRQF